MAGIMYRTSAFCCFLAVIVSCSARPKDSSEEDNSIEGKKTPMSKQEIKALWNQYQQNPGAQISKETSRDFTSQAYQTAGIQLNRIAQHQIRKLKNRMSSLSGLSTSEFNKRVSQISPDRLHQIGESIFKIGKQVNSEELIEFGEELSESNQLNASQIEKLRKFEQLLFRDVKKVTDSVQLASPINQLDTSEILEKTKTQLTNQLNVIQQLSELIEKRVSSASQMSESETAAVKEKIQQIQSLGSKIQSELSQQLDGSELSQIGEELLKLQELSSQLQQSVSAQVIQEKAQEVSDAVSQTSDSQNSISLQARDSLDENVDNTIAQTPRNPPKIENPWNKRLEDWKMFLQNIKICFDQFKKPNKAINNNQGLIVGNLEKMPTFTQDSTANQQSSVGNLEKMSTLTQDSTASQQSQTSNTNNKVDSNLATQTLGESQQSESTKTAETS